MLDINLILSNDLYFHCDQGYGDCIVALHILNKLCEKNPRINCFVYIPKHYQKQLAELIEGKKIKFIDNINYSLSIDLWCITLLGNSIYDDIHISHQDSNLSSYSMWVYEMGNYLNMKHSSQLYKPFDSIEEVVLNESCFAKDSLKEDFDYLVINGYPVSPIMVMSREEQDNNFKHLLKTLTEQGNKVITTVKVDGYRSTADYGLNLVDIGKLAKRCKNIVGIPNAPFIACINEWSMNNVERFVCFMDRINTKHPYLDMARTFDIDDRFSTVKTLYNW